MGILNITPKGNLVANGGGKNVAQALTNKGDSANGTTTGTTDRIALPDASNANFYRLVSDTDIYYKLGDDSVEASASDSAMLLAGIVEFVPKEAYTHIAFINK